LGSTIIADRSSLRTTRGGATTRNASGNRKAAANYPAPTARNIAGLPAHTANIDSLPDRSLAT